MEKTVWKARSGDREFMRKYRAVLKDAAALHKAAVQAVRDETGFTDDRAVQAAAFTIRKDALEAMARPGLVFWRWSEDPARNLIDFGLLAQTVDDPVEAFVKLTVEIGVEATAAQIRKAMNRTEVLTRMTFEYVEDHLALARSILARTVGNRELHGEALVQAFGRNLEKVAGMTKKYGEGFGNGG